MPNHPEPFRSELAAGRAARAADLPARTPEELFARAQARLACGRDREARVDLESCLPALGDQAQVELAYLDIRERADLDSARVVLQTIAEQAPAQSELAARARHLLGLAEGKLRRSEAAVAALLDSAAIYRERGQRSELAQVHDTLGSVFAAQGRLDHATGHYALSLVAKTRVGDRYGLALTLGNLGRTYLRGGRFHEALDTFALDLEIATELGDLRGVARMHEDRGRTWLALGDLRRAEAELRECLRRSEEQGYRDLACFAHKDLALLLARKGQAAEAGAELDAAERALAGGGEPYLEVLLLAARAQCRMLAGASDALELLQRACDGFASFDLPDHEIPALLALSRELVRRERRREAETLLQRATLRARRDGYARYLPQIREEMARLALVEPLVHEQGRAVASELAAESRPTLPESAGGAAAPDAAAGGANEAFAGAEQSTVRTSNSAASDGYVLLERLGSGGFGEVFKAYDPQRGELVAFKRLDLARLYEPRAREHRLESARRELEAVSRLRHPGIARVFALGSEPDGSTYVVQELVAGGSLRRRIPRGPTSALLEVVETIGRVCEALCVVHAAGVVHRDLKPENILLREPERVPVLIDFGMAHVPARGLDERHVGGTLAYMAPEQADGVARPEADLYSIGVILFEWLTGERPIRARSGDLGATLEELRTRPPTPIRTLRTDVPGEIVELLDSLLAKDPDDRITAEQVAEVCALLVRDLGRGR